MTLLQFRPVVGRLDEILDMLMHSREVGVQIGRASCRERV